MKADYLKLVLQNIKHRKLRSWLTMLGIFIGIAAVVSLIGLGEGLRSTVTSQFGFLGADIITVRDGGIQFAGPPGSGVVNQLNTDLVPKLEKISGVKYVIPRLIKSAEVEFSRETEVMMVGSLPSGNERTVIENMVGLKSAEGRLLKDGDGNKVFLGNHLANNDFEKKIRSGDRILIQKKQFQVVGVGKELGSFLLDHIVFMNEEVMRDLYDKKDEASVIAIQIGKGEESEKVKQEIEKILRKERNVEEGEEDFTVELAVDVLDSLDSTLFAVQLFVYIIAGISLIVGGIGISSTMFTAVIERTKDIGIMKSIGAKNSDIFSLFLIESGMVGLFGGMIGVILGIGIAKSLAFLGSKQLGTDLIQANISFSLIIGAVLFSFIIGCIAGTIPAIKASKLNPVDSLRFAK